MLGLQFPPVAEDRDLPTRATFIWRTLPVFVLYVFTAFLARTPRTRFLRMLLLPVTLLLAYRAAVTIHPSEGAPGYSWMDFGHCLEMFIISMRAIEWAFIKTPLRRSESVASTPLWDTFDLCTNLRGGGWAFSKGLLFPPEHRNVKSWSSFYTSTLLRAITHLTIYDACHYIVQLWGPHSFGSPMGGSIFDPALPQPWRYIRATIISFFCGLVVMFFLDAIYDVGTLLLLPILPPHDPSGWPPLSNKPWLAHSIAEFWGSRWHQTFRNSFIAIGAAPLSLLVGRRAAPLGAFIISGLLHDLSMWGMGRGIDPRGVVGFFGIMGVGCILEALWTATTGRRISGWVGRLWTITWILGWSSLLIEAWLTRGLAGSVLIPTPWRPGKRLIDLVLHISR